MKNLPKQPADVGPFEDDKLYRYHDLEERGLVDTYNTLKSWQQRFAFPSGRLVGHTRVWSGRELNTWYLAQPTTKLLRNRTRAA